MEIPDITIMGIPAAMIAPGLGLSEGCGRFIPEAVEWIVEMRQGVTKDLQKKCRKRGG
ncbi:MAG: hypothetical protein HZB32_07645 [Nitrospirae bacterium]|nr:hypothetical protein [Nitrospirota bacterium]